MTRHLKTSWAPRLEALERRRLLGAGGGGQDTTTYTTSTSTSTSEVKGPGENFIYGQAYVESLASSGPTQATVDYGDGTPLQTLTEQANGTFALQHLYAKAGAYQVKLSQVTVTTQVSTAVHSITVGNFVLGTYTVINTNTNTNTQITTLLAKESPASLTIQANCFSIVRGEPLPRFTASYIGFVNGDTPANLTALPVFTCSADAQSGAGSYQINPSGASSANYAITYEPGRLTIQVKPGKAQVTQCSWTPDTVVICFSGPIDPSRERFTLRGLHCGKPVSVAGKSYGSTGQTVTLYLRGANAPIDTNHHSYVLKLSGQVQDSLVLQKHKLS